ncbi:MAG: hypothetical protein HUU34_19035 [Saprospiraceae bacterium]|jgi:hypothetical protein|nr:hypothetical protein [Saprospiraceae bacterium]
MGLNPVKLRNIAWGLSIIFAILGIILMLSIFAFSAPPWTPGDILITFAVGGLYVSGLLIGKKWPLTGGVMSLISPIVAVISIVVVLLRVEPGSGIIGYVGSSMIMFLIMMIPGFLYLLSWYLQRKLDQNEQIDKGS